MWTCLSVWLPLNVQSGTIRCVEECAICLYWRKARLGKRRSRPGLLLGRFEEFVWICWIRNTHDTQMCSSQLDMESDFILPGVSQSLVSRQLLSNASRSQKDVLLALQQIDQTRRCLLMRRCRSCVCWCGDNLFKDLKGWVKTSVQSHDCI